MIAKIKSKQDNLNEDLNKVSAEVGEIKTSLDKLINLITKDQESV